MPDTILPADLTADEEREAARSLKGHILRQEIYALDGSDKQPHPYSVSERNYEIRVEQKLASNRHAVFFPHDRETIDCHYERSFILDSSDPEPDPKKKRKIFDPRVTHAMKLEVDEFGNVLKSVAIAYPRRVPQFPEQGQIQGQNAKGKPLITYTENQVTNKPNEDTWYRIGVPVETRTYEITGLDVTGLPSFIPFALDFIRTEIAKAIEIQYEESASVGIQKWLIERVRTLYRANSGANTANPQPLGLGDIDSMVLPYESYKLAFTPGLLAQIYKRPRQNQPLEDLLPNPADVLPIDVAGGQIADRGGYVQMDGGWWIPSGRQAFVPAQFYRPVQMQDPFGQIFQTDYDDYHLLVKRTEDPLQNVVQIQNNYRVMQPQQITDPNGNRSQTAFDALGMVVGTAVMGKVTESLGDSLTNFNADLSKVEIAAFFAAVDPRSQAIQHLGTATTRFIYPAMDFHR